MKTIIESPTNTGFFEKHAGKRTPANIIRLLLQVVSFSTASYGAYSIFPIEQQYIRLGVSLLLCFCLEIIVGTFYWNALLPWCEKIKGNISSDDNASSTGIYNIESDVVNIDTYLKKVIKGLYYGAIACSAILTVLGSFELGADLKDAGPMPLFDTYASIAADSIPQRPTYANDPRIVELSTLSASIDEKTAYIADQDALNTKAREDFNASQKKGNSLWGLHSSAKTWFEKTGKAEKAELTDMQTRRATLSDALAGLNEKMDTEINALATRWHDEALAEWEQKSSGSTFNGTLFLLFGFMAQIGVVFLQFFVCLIDVGTGAIPKYKPGRFDRVNLPKLRLATFIDRINESIFIGTVNYSKKPLKKSVVTEWGKIKNGTTRKDVSTLRIFQGELFDLFEEINTPTLTNKATPDDDFQDILNNVYKPTKGGLNGSAEKVFDDKKILDIDNAVQTLFSELQAGSLTDLDGIDNFNLFSFDTRSFNHILDTTVFPNWKRLSLCASSSRSYASKAKKSSTKLGRLIARGGNGREERKTQKLLDNQGSKFNYWIAAKSVLHAIHTGKLDRAGVEEINAAFRKQYFETKTVKI